MCACVFKLYAHYTTRDNSSYSAAGQRRATVCVFARLLVTHSPAPTCRFIIHLGQQTSGTQREVNVKQIVDLPHSWRASALFAWCIRHTQSRERHQLQKSLHLEVFTRHLTHLWDVKCLDLAWCLKNLNNGSGSYNQALFFFFFPFKSESNYHGIRTSISLEIRGVELHTGGDLHVAPTVAVNFGIENKSWLKKKHDWTE